MYPGLVTGLSQRSPPSEPGLVEQDRLPLQRRYVALCRWCPGLPPPVFLPRRAFFFFTAGSAPAAARAAPPSPPVATPVYPVSDCVFAAAAAVAVCPVCSPSSRCRFFVAGADAAPAVSLLAAAHSNTY